MGPSRMVLSKPVIAAISGHAVAGGLELALWCDLRVADEDAVLGVFCRRFGVPLIDGGTIRLPRLIGLSRALDLILTGRAVSAQEALSFGLVNRVVAREALADEARAMADQVAKVPAVTARAVKSSINAMVDRMGQRDSWRHHFLVHQYVSNTDEALGRMAKRAEGGMDHVKREQSGDAGPGEPA